MKKLSMFWVLMLTIFGLIAQPVAAATAQAPKVATPDLTAKSAIVIDAKSGQILADKNRDQVLPIASMTKMITLYLVLEAIKDKTITWDQEVRPTKEIADLSQNTELASVPLSTDKTYSIKSLYQATLLASANDAAMLLAQAVSGSQVKFVEKMRAQLKKWHLTHGQVYNVSGLENSYLPESAYVKPEKDGQENELSATEMAQIAQHLLNDYPEILKTAGMPTSDFDGTTVQNSNLMLPESAQAPNNGIIVDGLKTGTGEKAGDCFAGTAKLHGRRVITIVMHANADGQDLRFNNTEQLMTTVLNDWHVVTSYRQKKPIQKIKVANGQAKTVPVKPTKTLTYWQPNDTQALVKLRIKTPDAPVEKNQKVGTLTVEPTELGYLPGAKKPQTTVVSTKTVAKLHWWQRLF